MSRTIRIVVTFAMIVFLSASAAAAQSAEPFRIGAVRLAYVTQASKTGKAAIAQLQQLVSEKEAAATARASEIQKQTLEAQKTNSALLQRALDRMKVDYQRFQQDAQAEIEGMQARFEADFRIRLQPVLDEISKEKGLHFVFGIEEAPMIAWWSPAVDISEEVVKRLDAAK